MSQRIRSNKMVSSESDLPNYTEATNKRKRFGCNQCSNTFAQKAILNTHIKSIHEGERHICESCNKMFSTRGNMLLHYKRVHEKVKYNGYFTV